MSEQEQETAAPEETKALVLDEHPLVYATDSQGMSVAGVQMLDFFRRRRDEMAALEEEQAKAYEHALAHKWAAGALKRATAETAKRVVFYDKAVKALEAGYLVIPNLPLDLFVVRTSAKKPRGAGGGYNDNAWANGHGTHPQRAALEPAGEGRNRNPLPGVDSFVYAREVKNRDGSIRFDDVTMSRPNDWLAIEFPLALAKPEIMTQTQRAMALKVFDEVGVVNDHIRRSAMVSRRADPIIVGRLLNPRARRPDLSFFIAWAADLTRI